LLDPGESPVNGNHPPDLALDLDFVRAQFPAFEEPTLQGWGFFENAGGSYACRQVIDRLTGFYRRTKVQPYYDYPASRAAGEAMDEAYVRLAGYLNVGVGEVHLGPSTTQNVDILARALRELWRVGDEIVVTNQDHEANSGAWRKLERSGIVVREWQIDPQSGLLDPAALDELLNERTRLVAFPHCSNIIGQVNPVAEIAHKAKRVGATVVVDGVSYAPHGLPDVAALGVDVYLFSLYKTWGPHLGLMTVRSELMDCLPNQGHFFNADNPRKKLLVAGPDHGQIAAAAGVAEYLDAVFAHHFPGVEVPPAERGRRLHDLFRAHETRLLEPLLSFLNGREDVRLLGPSVADEGRAPTVAFLPTEGSPDEVFTGLVDRQLMVGIGDFYGVRPLSAMGVPRDPGVIRLSFVHYTSVGEVDQLINALGAALG
jgi:cysteine desulfurase family protein (TIGR01976 family)